MLGLAVILLAIVGAAVLIMLAANGVRSLTDDTEEREKYEAMLAPVVLNDPDPFDDVSHANMTQLLDITIWALLNGDDQADPNEYEEHVEGDSVYYLVPKEDVEATFAKLFGSDVKPVHSTVGGGSYEFVYDEARGCYVVPFFSLMPVYTPKVYEIKKEDRSIVLTVGYIPASEWKQDNSGSLVGPDPDKFMKITLRERDGGYYISAIQATDKAEIAQHTKTTEPTTLPSETTTEEPTTQKPTEPPSETNTAA